MLIFIWQKSAIFVVFYNSANSNRTYKNSQNKNFPIIKDFYPRDVRYFYKESLGSTQFVYKQNK